MPGPDDERPAQPPHGGGPPGWQAPANGWAGPASGWGPPTGYGPDGAPWWGPAPVPHTSARAVWVLILGIASLPMLMMCLLGLPAAVAALCLAPGAKREIRASGGWVRGEGQVLVGVICSWISVTFGALALLFLWAVWSWHLNWSVGEQIRF